MRLVALAACAVSVPLLLSAQIQLGGLDRPAPAKKQHVELLTDALQVTADKPEEVELRFRVEPGFHINSHQPKDELLIPTNLKVDPGKVRVTVQQYPAGSTFHLAVGSGEDLSVYQGEFRIAVRVTAPKGSSTLNGSLHYQACDTAACYPAKTLPLQIAVTAH